MHGIHTNRGAKRARTRLQVREGGGGGRGLCLGIGQEVRVLGLHVVEASRLVEVGRLCVQSSGVEGGGGGRIEAWMKCWGQLRGAAARFVSKNGERKGAEAG